MQSSWPGNGSRPGFKGILFYVHEDSPGDIFIWCECR